MGIRAVAFDVANTLLHKEGVVEIFRDCFLTEGVEMPLDRIKNNHHIIREHITFPDVTDATFYRVFNTAVCNSLGINPSPALLMKLFEKCKEISWEAYSDTKMLEELNLPIYIYSNFHKNLPELLNLHFNLNFSGIIISELVGCAKPSCAFYEEAINKTPFEPNEILYVGDSFLLDYIPAKSLGISTLLIDRDNHYPGCGDRITTLNMLKTFLL